MLKFSNDKGSMKISIMVCGKPKSGKTLFAGSMPNPVFINCDKGMVTLRDKKIPFWDINRPTEGSSFTPYSTIRQIISSLKSKSGQYWNELVSAGYVPETIVIDSISAMSDLFESECIQNPPDGKPRPVGLQLQDYNFIQNNVYNICDSGRELATMGLYNFVVTSGIETALDDSQRKIEAPAATGNKLGQRLPHFFDEVFVIDKEVNPANNNVKYVMSSKPSYSFKYSGSRMSMEPIIVESPSYEKLKVFYKG